MEDEKFYSVRDVSKILSEKLGRVIRTHQINYGVLERGACPSGVERFGNQRAFTAENISELEEYFK